MREGTGGRGRKPGATSALAVAAVLVALVAGEARGQVRVSPRVIQIDKVTCAELLAEHGDVRDRLLIYLNGYLDGRRQQRTWDEAVVGQRIERALDRCKSNPSATVLDTFSKAWDR